MEPRGVEQQVVQSLQDGLHFRGDVRLQKGRGSGSRFTSPTPKLVTNNVKGSGGVAMVDSSIAQRAAYAQNKNEHQMMQLAKVNMRKEAHKYWVKVVRKLDLLAQIIFPVVLAIVVLNSLAPYFSIMAGSS